MGGSATKGRTADLPPSRQETKEPFSSKSSTAMGGVFRGRLLYLKSPHRGRKNVAYACTIFEVVYKVWTVPSSLLESGVLVGQAEVG